MGRVLDMTFINPLLLSIEEITEISNFAHWIPITRGYHHDHLAEHYPGWEWNDFLPVLHKARLIRTHIDGHACTPLRQGICIRPDVIAVELIQGKKGTKVSRVHYTGEGEDTEASS